MVDLEINEEFKSLIPKLSTDEYKSLENSLIIEGIRDPIYVWNGVIVDGHNRYGLAKKNNLHFSIKQMSFDSSESVKIWILTNQLSRRNVTPFVRAELEMELETLHRSRLKALRAISVPTVLGIKTELPELPKDTRESIAKAAGVSYGYIHTVSRIKNSGKVDKDVMDKLRSGKITASKVLKEIKREERKDHANQKMQEVAKLYKPDDSLQIINADFYKWCNDNISNASIDLIITDPPYPKEYLHVWNQLGEVAARVLKPGCYLATYSGQLYLDYVMKSLGEHLSYVWTIALQHTGATQLVHPRNLICRWKPILLYRKHDIGKTKETGAGKIEGASGSALNDFIGDDYREKGFHEWGQGETAIGYLMKTLSYPNDLVLDPFVGGGTTLVVAKDLKRRCIGIEIDKQYISKIKTNIMNSDTKLIF